MTNRTLYSDTRAAWPHIWPWLAVATVLTLIALLEGITS